MKQKKPIREGQLNRSRILNELIVSPLTFSQLKTKVELSGKTLTKHLKDLSNESLVKREIQGKYIVYKSATPQTVLDLRKTFREELNRLLLVYWNCLDNETGQLLNQVIVALTKSIDQPDWRAGLKIIEKTIPIPEGKRAVITQDSNLYRKPEVRIPKKRKGKLAKREK